MARTVNFFDGASSGLVPTIGNVVASDLVTYSSDAAYEAANLGAPTLGNIYVNSISNVIRYYNGTTWISVVDESTTQTVENKTIDGTSATGNNTVKTDASDVDYSNTTSGLTATDTQTAIDEVEGRVDTNETNISTNAGNISTNAGDIDDLETLSGSPGATDHGTFSGTTIPDNSTTKGSLQSLETKAEQNTTDIGTNDTDITNLQNDKEDKSDKGAINGYCPLDGAALVPAANLPSYVDDVLEYANLAAFPVTGESGKIYIAIDTNFQYRWTGSIYVDITSKVDSVNGESGAVTLTTDDISDAAQTNKWSTQGEKDKLGNISVTQAVDLDTMESDIATNNAKVTNATHTGEVTGDTALTVDKTTITNKTEVVPEAGDFVLFSDTSDGGNLKKANVDELLGAGGGGTGEGGINYITNSGAELDLTGWTTYDDGTAVPVDGTGGGIPASEISQLTDTATHTFGGGGATTYYGMTYTTVSGFNLYSIKIKLGKNLDATGNISLQVWGTSGGDPDNSVVIATSTNSFDVSLFPTDPTSNIVEFFFSGEALSGATVYSFIINTTGLGGDGFLNTRRVTTSAYAGGNTVYDADGIAPWTHLTTNDLYFDIYSSAPGGLIPLTRDTTNKMIGDASFKLARPASDTQGSGARADFTIDSFYKDRKLNFEIKHKNDSNYTSADYKIYIYDVLNTNLIGTIMNDDNGDMLYHDGEGATMQGSFFTTDSLDYRLLIHNTVTDAIATDVNFDSVRIFPQEFAPGAIVTKPQPFTPVWTNFSLGNGTVDKANWWRVGSEMHGYISVTLGSTSTVTGAIQFDVPNGKLIDNTIVDASPDDALGEGIILDTGFSRYVMKAYANGTGKIATRWLNAAAIPAGINATTPMTWTTNDRFNLSFKVPIENWEASNLVSTTEQLNRVARAKLNLSTQQNGLGTTNTKILFDTVDYDYTGLFSASDNGFKIREKGTYVVATALGHNNLSTNDRMITRILVNGGVKEGRLLNGVGGVGNVSGFSYCEFDLEVDDIVNVYQQSTVDASYSVVIDPDTTWFSIHRLPEQKVYGVYGEFSLVSAESSVKVPTGSAIYLNMTGNDITLTPGTWELKPSRLRFTNAGVCSYTRVIGRWFAANGADSGTTPALLSTATGLTVLNDSIDGNVDQLPGGNNDWTLGTTSVFVRVTEPVTIYLVPYVIIGTPGNGRVYVYPTAEKKQ